MSLLRLVRAIARRRWAESRVDRFAHGIEIGSILFFLLAVGLMSRIVPAGPLGAPSYLSFVVLGLLSYFPVAAALTGPTTLLRSERTFGTLEPILLSRTPFPRYLLAAGALDAAWGLARGTAYPLLGILLAGATIPSPSPLLLLGLPLAFLAAHGLGLAGAAIDLALDRGKSVVLLATGLLSILSGVYFPIGLFPGSGLLVLLPTVPLAAFARGTGSFSDLVILAVEAIVYLLAGRAALELGLARARRAGSLARRD